MMCIDQYIMSVCVYVYKVYVYVSMYIMLYDLCRHM